MKCSGHLKDPQHNEMIFDEPPNPCNIKGKESPDSLIVVLKFQHTYVEIICIIIRVRSLDENIVLLTYQRLRIPHICNSLLQVKKYWLQKFLLEINKFATKIYNFPLKYATETWILTFG